MTVFSLDNVHVSTFAADTPSAFSDNVIKMDPGNHIASCTTATIISS